MWCVLEAPNGSRLMTSDLSPGIIEKNENGAQRETFQLLMLFVIECPTAPLYQLFFFLLFYYAVGWIVKNFGFLRTISRERGGGWSTKKKTLCSRSCFLLHFLLIHISSLLSLSRLFHSRPMLASSSSLCSAVFHFLLLESGGIKSSEVFTSRSLVHAPLEPSTDDSELFLDGLESPREIKNC